MPFTAGGSVDVTARMVADKLSEKLRQSVVVDNVGGAGGTVGVGKAVQAAPDGYTLVMGVDSAIAIAPYANPKAVRYNVARDLVPVGLVNTAPMVLVARPGHPLVGHAVPDLAALARHPWVLPPEGTPSRAHFERFMAPLPAGARPRFIGAVDEADLPALYAGAAVFAFPSRYEGFGLPPLEAMACGTPVVAAAASSLPEVVGEAGLLIAPEDPSAWARALVRLPTINGR